MRIPNYKYLCNYDHGRRGVIDIEIKGITIYFPLDGNPYYKGTGIGSDGLPVRFNTHGKHFYFKEG